MIDMNYKYLKKIILLFHETIQIDVTKVVKVGLQLRVRFILG